MKNNSPPFPGPGLSFRLSAGWNRVGVGACGAFLLLVLTGCRTVWFYKQAIAGHAQIMSRREPIVSLLEDPEISGELKGKLELVMRLTQFADQNLHLPAANQYRHYADLRRPFAVWDLYAAPQFSLEPKKWWYPFVGRLSYRGYFRESDARAYAHDLERRDYDVFVGGVDAYSTLGWFRDPVLNTFIYRDEADLADLIFHELAHQKLFVPGDTDFNEAFATTVAREGVRQWLLQQNRVENLLAWRERIRREEQFAALVLATRARLQELYTQKDFVAGGSGRSHPAVLMRKLREQKEDVFRDLRHDYECLKEQWGGATEWDAWFDWPVNNARLNAEATYYELVPALETLLSLTQGELNRFYREVALLGGLKPEERTHLLRNWIPETVRALQAE